jgi:hypothetical protein
MMRSIRLILMFGLCLAFGGPALAALIIVRAVGPSASSYPTGAILDGGLPVSLKKGDRLTLLDGTGTRILVGPRSGKLTIPSKRSGVQARGTIDELRLIFNRSRERRSALGASRGFAMPPGFSHSLPPSLWAINVEKGGNWCVPANMPASLVRYGAGLPATLEMRTAGQIMRVDFPKGVKEVPLPAMSNGEALLTLFANNRPIRKLAIRLIQPSDGDIVELAQHLLENECYDQIDLIQTVTG